MADVLIVCVREDELQAKALADMFERAGFSVGGAPATDAALRSTGAGVIVWSQASIRSRPFLDAAQRVIDAEKAVIASLIDPPPPHTVRDAPAFALNGWTGDPEDSALDPLFFAVDRMVTSQRAAIGASPARPAPEAFQEPPSLRPPPSYARHRSDEPHPPPRSAPRPPERPTDRLGAESEHWRAIRDSRDPADYMDYLARYGPDGAFSEVAELKLKQLTAPSAPASLRDAARSSASAPVRQRRPDPSPTLAPRAEPQPRRPEPRLDASLRLPDAGPPPRRSEPPPPRREPAYARTLDRPPPEPRDSARMGGLLRVAVLVALLGGGGYAAFNYYAGQAPPELTAAQDAATEAPFDQASALGVGGSDIAEEPLELSSAAPPVRREPPRRQPVRAAAIVQTPDQPTPAPQTSWNTTETNVATGGPASLIAGAPAPISPTILAANLPAPAPLLAAATNAPARPPHAAASVLWAQRPSARRIADLYPARAQRDGTGGRAELDCSVRADLGLSCAIVSEAPAGGGFGRAALTASGAYRVRPTLSDGVAAPGARTRIAIVFQPPPE